MPLNKKQKQFIAEFLIDQNATKAATRAGYSKRTAKVQGCRLMKNNAIKNAIEEEQNKLAMKHDITKDTIITELAKIAFLDIRKTMNWTHDTLTIKPSHLLDDDVAAAISEVIYTKDGVKIKVFDKKAALMDLAKMLGFMNVNQDSADDNSAIFDIKRIEHVIINPDNIAEI